MPRQRATASEGGRPARGRGVVTAAAGDPAEWCGEDIVEIRPIYADGAPAGLRVGELHRLLDEAARSAGLGEVWVTGTVAGLRAGPRFTTLELVDYERDGSTVHAVLAVGMFASHARQVRNTLAAAGVELADGLEVTLWGALDPNPRYGRLRLLAQRADPRTTIGAAVLARDELVAELERSGRLRAQASLSVPATPRRIGLVSSPAAAGRADVFEVLQRSPAPIEVVEAQAAMSGPAAPAEVARAIGLLADAGVDVVLIARGGGAKSDLAPWESRPVALAITSCPVPVWTALGHATDHTLADALANAHHPTPSAAAGAIVARAEAAMRALDEQARQARHAQELASSRARARRAVVVAVLVVIVALALVVASRL